MNDAILIALLIPFAGTALGSACVFLLKDNLPNRVQKGLLGFASGVMVAAAVWSLLIPSLEMGQGAAQAAGSCDATGITLVAGMGALPAAGGFIIGMLFLLLLDYITPHIHLDDKPEGPRSGLSRTAKLALAVTLHNIPEGMAVGVAFAGAFSGADVMSVAGATALAVGIAIQNFPEGAIISMPLKNSGKSRWQAFWVGTLSGAVEPVGAILMILLASVLTPLMPWFLSFAAGAMMYVVIEELIPETAEGQHSNLGTIGFTAGFALMMVLDVVFG